MHLRCFFLVKIVAVYALLVCKIFGPKIQPCKFFDKYQVCLSHRYIHHHHTSLIAYNIIIIVASGNGLLSQRTNFASFEIAKSSSRYFEVWWAVQSIPGNLWAQVFRRVSSDLVLRCISALETSSPNLVAQIFLINSDCIALEFGRKEMMPLYIPPYLIIFLSTKTWFSPFLWKSENTARLNIPRRGFPFKNDIYSINGQTGSTHIVHLLDNCGYRFYKWSEWRYTLCIC